MTNKQRLIQRQKVSQAKEVVVLGGKELDCSHKQQQKQEQRQFLGEGQGEGRSGPGFERGPGPAVDSDTPSGSDDDSNEGDANFQSEIFGANRCPCPWFAESKV